MMRYTTRFTRPKNKQLFVGFLQWRSKGGQVGLRPWKRNSTLFAVILNEFLSRNLDQSMLKNAYFWGKNCKNCLSVGRSAPKPPLACGGWRFRPQTPALLLPPTITTLSSLFLVLNTF